MTEEDEKKKLDSEITALAKTATKNKNKAKLEKLEKKAAEKPDDETIKAKIAT